MAAGVRDLMVHDIDLALHVVNQQPQGSPRVTACGYDSDGIAYVCAQYVSLGGAEVEMCCGRLPGAQVRHIRASGDVLACHADLLRRLVDLQGPSAEQRKLLVSAPVDALGAQLQEFIRFLGTGDKGRLAMLDSVHASLIMCAEIEELAEIRSPSSATFAIKQ